MTTSAKIQKAEKLLADIDQVLKLIDRHGKTRGKIVGGIDSSGRNLVPLINIENDNFTIETLER